MTHTQHSRVKQSFDCLIMKYLPVVILFVLHLLHIPLSASIPHSYSKYAVSGGNRKILRDDALYCESWKFVVETNDATPWQQVPSRCEEFVKFYITLRRYQLDSEAVADAAIGFAKSVNVSGDGKDAWVFDIDETLLTNVPYYAKHGFGSEKFDEQPFNQWVNKGKAPALAASLRLYLELEKLGFTIFLLTGREEIQRNVTVDNLHLSGYSNWKRLILRGSSDHGKPASIFKSGKRKELEEEGYRIHGCSGDQWSDLVGFATADKSFKLPNPMYYIA